jgi:hypothetical protein
MLELFFIGFGEYYNVIKIDDYKFIPFSNENDVHGSFEGFSCIHQSKGNFGIHECAPRSFEGCLFSVFRKDKYLIVSEKTINHGNLGCTCYPLQYVFHLWQRVIVLLRDSVQILEIDTQSDFSIFIPHWNQVGYPLKIFQRDNDLGVQQLLYLPFHNRKQHGVCLS